MKINQFFKIGLYNGLYTFVIISWLSVITVFAANWYDGFSAKGGNTLTSAKWNLASMSTFLPGYIGAFNSTTCPDGWMQANGANGTPDLRGQFLRGLNSFDAGASTRSDGNQDIDGAARTLKSFQADEFKSHNHTLIYERDFSSDVGIAGRGVNNRLPNLGAAGYNAPRYREDSDDMPMRGGTETRPKNVAVIFCVKQ